MNILLIVLIYAIVAAADLYSIRGSGKGIIIFHILCLVGSMVTLLLHDMDIMIHSPAHWISRILQ